MVAKNQIPVHLSKQGSALDKEELEDYGITKAALLFTVMSQIVRL